MEEKKLKDIKVVQNLNDFNLFRDTFEKDSEIILSYHGVFTNRVIGQIKSHLKTYFKKKENNFWKIFKIFLELGQNISAYSAEKKKDNGNYGVGSIVIFDIDDAYVLVSFNVTSPIHLLSLKKRYEEISGKDVLNLREFKRSLFHEQDNKYGGANLGFIDIAIHASNNLDIEFGSIDRMKSFLLIRTILFKKNVIN